MLPAGVWGVPRFFILPPRLGARGLKSDNAGGFRLVLPTLQLGSTVTTKRGPPRFDVDSRLLWGVQRGEAPLHCSQSPKIEDPPQEEWGMKGVEKSELVDSL